MNSDSAVVPARGRVEWIDGLKGLATILVVIGHVFVGYLDAGLFEENTAAMKAVHDLIYSFHMPFFFSISGYVFYLAYLKNKDTCKDRIKRQTADLIFIYIIFSVIQWVFKYFLAGVVNSGVDFSDLLLIAVKPMNPYWYIYVLVFYYTIFYFMGKTGLSDNCQLLFSALLSLAGSFVNSDVIFPLRHFLLNIFFFYLGIYLAKNISAAPKISIVVTGVISLAAMTFSALYSQNLLGIPVLGVITAAVTALFFVLLFRCNDLKIGFLNLIGRYSLEIYLTHCYITAANRIILMKLGVTEFFINVIVNCLMAIFIPVLCAWILKKCGLHRWIFSPFKTVKKQEK